LELSQRGQWLTAKGTTAKNDITKLSNSKGKIELVARA